MTQLLLLVTVVGGAGTLMAFVYTMPNKIRTTAIELGGKIDRLSDAIDNQRRCHERLETQIEDQETRIRTLEVRRRASGE